MIASTAQAMSMATAAMAGRLSIMRCLYAIRCPLPTLPACGEGFIDFPSPASGGGFIDFPSPARGGG